MDESMKEDVPMNHATIQIYPIQNRFEAYVHSNPGKEEILTGLLENLLSHLPQIKDLCDKGSDASFDLYLPEELHGEEWFTRSIFERFLHFVNSPHLIIATSGIMEEMFQLEETKKFHLSLHIKGHLNHMQSGRIDGKDTTDLAPNSISEVEVESSDASKSKLLRAMDLRLTALSKELMTNFDKATSAHIPHKDVSYLVEFAQHFGATNLENFLRRFLEIIGKWHCFDVPAAEKSSQTRESKIDDVDNTTKDGRCVRAITPIKYGASPAKVAEVERQSSTESEESSCSSDEDQPSAERSRTLIRFATPRRSASPMKKVQIGRTGNRRPATIAIKSPNLFPAKDGPLLHRDMNGNGIEGEVSEQPKKTVVDVRRITVQDAINLFERKQKDQTADKNGRSLADVVINTKKSVLRRWSTGMGEGHAGHQLQNISEDATNPSNFSNFAIRENNSEAKTEPDHVSEIHSDNKTAEYDVKQQGQENEWSLVESQSQNDLTQVNRSRKSMTSTEWSQQKEAELNQMLIKMMETKTVKSGNPQISKTQNLKETRGGLYDSYKEKRDAKFRAENSCEREEKQAQFQPMQKMLEKRKAEMATKPANSGKKNVTRNPPKSVRNSSQHENSPKEASKTSVARKGPSKISRTSVTRKSWPAAPSPRDTGLSPANVRGGISSAGRTPTQRKSQQKTMVPQRILRKEKPQKQERNVKETQSSGVRSLKSLDQKRKPAAISKSKLSKQKDATPARETSIPSNLSTRNKGTKKSSVVPLAQKPSSRKISGIGNVASPVNKKTDSPKLEKSLKKSEILVENQEKELVHCAADETVQHQGVDDEKLDHHAAAVEANSVADSHQQCSESESLEQVGSEDANVLKIMGDSSAEIKAEEEPSISPSAWVEIEEEHEVNKPHRTGALQPSYPADIVPVGAASPRVRHSLSQMLQQETSEPEICEWGNAENPPTIMYQKDAPKGLKRLLKFARKGKGDDNCSGWSSPSVFSEGEEDIEESKISSRRNAASVTKNHRQQKISLHEGYGKHIAQSNLSIFDGKNSHKMLDTYDGVAGSTNKGTRFFSLSAFRGKQTN